MGKTALVADDDFEVTQLLSVRLKELGFFVMRSPDASHALFGAQRLRPDLVILDVNMPGGNGLAAAEMMATDADFRDTTVIIYTGCSDGLTRVRCKYLGHRYVQKSPQGWDEIEAIACKVLDGEATQSLSEEHLAEEGDSSNASAATPQHCVGSTSVPQNDTGDHKATFSRTWAEIRAQTCQSLARETESTPLDLHPIKQDDPSRGCTAGSIERTEVAGNAEIIKSPFASDSVTPVRCDLSPVDRGVQVCGEDKESEVDKIDVKIATVLCIDDDPDMSKIIQMRLAAYDVQVLRAFSGMQGYWTALDSRPDVIIIDMAMPDGDGNYIIGRFKSHSLTENVPVIVLTGQSNPGVKRAMLSQGISAYLTKPLVFEELLKALRAHIELPEKSTAAATSCRRAEVRHAHQADSQPVKSSVGSESPCPAQAAPDIATAPSPVPEPKGRSVCEPWREVILAKIDQGLSKKRIWQELSAEHGFRHSYDSLRRFIDRLDVSTPMTI